MLQFLHGSPVVDVNTFRLKLRVSTLSFLCFKPKTKLSKYCTVLCTSMEDDFMLQMWWLKAPNLAILPARARTIQSIGYLWLSHCDTAHAGRFSAFCTMYAGMSSSLNSHPHPEWLWTRIIGYVGWMDGKNLCVEGESVSWFHVTSSDIGHLMITNQQGSQEISHDLVGFSVGSFHLLATLYMPARAHTHTQTCCTHTYKPTRHRLWRKKN